MTTAGSRVKVPDAKAAARKRAAAIRADRRAFLDAGLGRVLRDAPWVDKAVVVKGVTTYHRDAMSCIPPRARYPEARPWVEYVLTYERELKRLAHLDDAEIGIEMSLGNYLTFRGYRDAARMLRPPLQVEKCRCAFLPETDQGPAWIKNVDDPPNYWKPDPPLPARAPLSKLKWMRTGCMVDGVGSGLHIDDEPEQLFPLPIWQMVPQHVHDTPSCLEFLTRYAPFWGGSNNLIMDRQYRSLAIEKCSRNHMQVFRPDRNGHSHISGMACRDPHSTLGRYQKAKRAEYRRLFNLPADGPDNTFWRFCDKGERMLAAGLRRLGKCPRFDDLVKLFWTPYPKGLCKNGYRCHPDTGNLEYTLMIRSMLFEKRREFAWQRSQDCKVWPREPEVCQYG